MYSETPAEHLEHLEKVFLKLHAAVVKLKPKKCDLFHTQVNYLGHLLDKTGIRPDPKKLEAVRDWERPTTVTQVRSFTAFFNYYRVRTDHASLQWLFRQNADGMTFRIIQKMQEYNYRIVHRSGEKFFNAADLVEGPMRSQNGKKAKKNNCDVKSRSFKLWKKHSVVLKKI